MVFTTGLGLYFIRYTSSFHSQKDGISFMKKTQKHPKKHTTQPNQKTGNKNNKELDKKYFINNTHK